MSPNTDTGRVTLFTFSRDEIEGEELYGQFVQDLRIAARYLQDDSDS